jgi:adenylate cyclase
MEHSAELPLAGKVVFVGTSARGVSDAVATPVDSNMPGVEVVATTLDNLLQGDSVVDSGPARSLELIFILIACVVSGALAIRVGSLWAVPLLFACAAVLFIVCFGLLAFFQTLVSPLIFTASIIANLAIVMLLRFAEEKKRADLASQKVVEARNFLINTLTLLAGARDAETGAHLVRTQRYTRLLCDALATHPKFASFLTKETIDLIVQIVPLHDIGKIGVPDSILKKPGSLTPEEYRIIQRHVEYGYEVLEKARIRAGIQDESVLQLARDIVGSHHERWDGKGYPLGLKAELIPIPGRLVSVVDMYDALVSKRVYKDRISHEEAAKLIADSRGERFDPDVVDAFLRTHDQWREVAFQCKEDEEQSST